MLIGGTFIEDTYAEAFGLRAARLVITADTPAWAQTAALSMTGFATSIIACGCEAGMEGPAPETTPDGRPGVRVILLARSAADLQDQVVRRVGQCVMTAAGASCFDALGPPAPVPGAQAANESIRRWRRRRAAASGRGACGASR